MSSWTFIDVDLRLVDPCDIFKLSCCFLGAAAFGIGFCFFGRRELGKDGALICERSQTVLLVRTVHRLCI